MNCVCASASIDPVPGASLKLFEEADHSFHVPARTGLKDSQVRSVMLDTLAAWIDDVIAHPT